MDASFFENPNQIKETILLGLRRGQEEGSLDEEEVSRLVAEADHHAGKGKGRKGAQGMVLKGEGGSGERAQPPLVPSPEVEEKIGNWAEEMDAWENGGEEGGPGGDLEADQGDVSVQESTTGQSRVSPGGSQVEELRAYCEDQFASLLSMLTPLVARVEILERSTSVSIPFAAGLRRVGDTTSLSPPRHTRHASGAGGREGRASRFQPNPAVLARFFAQNVTYPSITSIRKAKLRNLQAELGMVPKEVDVRPSEWEANELAPILVALHQEG